jgi:hypothetical protein
VENYLLGGSDKRSKMFLQRKLRDGKIANRLFYSVGLGTSALQADTDPLDHRGIYNRRKNYAI